MQRRESRVDHCHTLSLVDHPSKHRLYCCIYDSSTLRCSRQGAGLDAILLTDWSSAYLGLRYLELRESQPRNEEEPGKAVDWAAYAPECPPSLEDVGAGQDDFKTNRLQDEQGQQNTQKQGLRICPQPECCPFSSNPGIDHGHALSPSPQYFSHSALFRCDDSSASKLCSVGRRIPVPRAPRSASSASRLAIRLRIQHTRVCTALRTMTSVKTF